MKYLNYFVNLILNTEVNVVCSAILHSTIRIEFNYSVNFFSYFIKILFSKLKSIQFSLLQYFSFLVRNLSFSLHLKAADERETLQILEFRFKCLNTIICNSDSVQWAQSQRYFILRILNCHSIPAGPCTNENKARANNVNKVFFFKRKDEAKRTEECGVVVEKEMKWRRLCCGGTVPRLLQQLGVMSLFALPPH